MKAKLQKLLIYLCAVLSGRKKVNAGTKVVYIPFFGRIGDGIMFLDMLESYKRLFPVEDGYKLVLGCRNEIKTLLNTLGLDDGLVICEVTREKLMSNARYFWRCIHEIACLKPDLILHVRMHSHAEDVYIHGIPAAKKISVKGYNYITSSKIRTFFSENTYDEVLVPSEDKDQLACYAEMLRYLGDKDYYSKIARFPRFECRYDFGRYVAVCPGASAENKCWPVDRYAKVIDYIIEEYDCEVVICGGANDVPVSEAIKKSAAHGERIKILAGKTSMTEWISIIQNSFFVLANESAATHIAASCAKKCVCIGEQKFADKWLPYRPEFIREDDQIPIVVRSEKLACSFCVSKGWFTAPECRACIKEHGVSRCVYEVTAEMVIKAVDEVMQSIT